ncbi:uncharacterized protein ACRADG_002972 [Cochliomyia hominivorax]
MKIFVIIAILTAYVYGAPTTELQHPSPVNPNVLVEIKPKEKIILITNPRELATFKRETNQNLYPTVLLREQVHHATKSPLINQNQEKNSPVKKDNKENLPQKLEERKDTSEIYQKTQSLLAIFSPSNKSIQYKRDIPVPLVPKYNHPEESPKEINKNENHGNKNIEFQTNVDDIEKHQILPLISDDNNQDAKKDQEKNEKHNENQHATKIELEKAQLIPFILKETFQGTQHKRDILVPLVPKHHHPEGSPKVSNEKEIYEDKKEIITENHYVNTERLLKTQDEPAATSKKADNNAQQQKPDTIMSKVVNNESPIYKKLPHHEKTKDELQTNNIAHDHHISPIITTHNQDNTIQKVSHVVPVHQIQSHHHEQFVQNSNEINRNEIQTHHIAPALQSHLQGHHFHPEILQKPYSITNGLNGSNQQKLDFNVYNIEPQNHFTGNFMGDTKQFAGDHPNPHQVQIEDLSDKIYQKSVHHQILHKHNDLNINASNENKEKVKKNADIHPNMHEVQIEDLSDKVYQKPIHEVEHKPSIYDDHSGKHSNLIRQPISVAEFFSR